MWVDILCIVWDDVEIIKDQLQQIAHSVAHSTLVLMVADEFNSEYGLRSLKEIKCPILRREFQEIISFDDERILARIFKVSNSREDNI